MTRGTTQRWDIFYASSRVVANLVLFALKCNLAGVVAVSVEDDDWSGACTDDTDTFDDIKKVLRVNFNAPRRSEAAFPLLKTINEVIDINNQLTAEKN